MYIRRDRHGYEIQLENLLQHGKMSIIYPNTIAGMSILTWAYREGQSTPMDKERVPAKLRIHAKTIVSISIKIKTLKTTKTGCVTPQM